MKVGQLAGGERVSIEAKRDNVNQSWETTVCEIIAEEDLIAIQKLEVRFPDYEFSFLNPIIENDMLVDFGSKEVKKTLVHTRAMESYAWKNIAIFNLSLPKFGRVHAVASSSEDSFYNRRGSYRIRVAKPGEVFVSGEQYPRSVIVNDISATGIGLIINDVEGISLNKELNVKFMDENRFNVKAFVRRIHELEPYRIVVGCEFEKFSDSIAQFVNNRQLQNRKAMKEREDRFR